MNGKHLELFDWQNLGDEEKDVISSNFNYLCLVFFRVIRWIYLVFLTWIKFFFVCGTYTVCNTLINSSSWLIIFSMRCKIEP